MNLSTFSNRISELLAIQTPMIWVVTQEEKIAEAAVVKEIMKANIVEHYYYCDTNGGFMMDPLSLKPSTAQIASDMEDQFAAMERGESFQYPDSVAGMDTALGVLRDAPEATALILRNVNDVFSQPNAQRALFNVCMRQEHKDGLYHPIIMISPDNEVPMMLRDFTTLIDLPLMTEKEKLAIIAGLAGKQGIEITKEEALTAARAATGLTTTQVVHAIKDSVHQTEKIMPSIINELRVQKIKQSSVLTYVEPKKTLDTVGGHDRLKKWVREVKACMTPEAEKAGVKAAKGYVSVGIAGTGKTAVAEAIANEMNVPLIIFDLSRVMGGIVGQSEQTARRAFETIESIGHCVCLIDECDKQFAGASSAVTGVADGGTIARVFDVVLQNLQKNAGQFYILTANDISKLPSPLMRAGRLDKKWFFGFPSEEDRKGIFRIYFKAADKAVSDDVVNRAARLADHFTGAEIETAVNNMVRTSFLQKSGITQDVAAQGVSEVSSVYATNREEVDELLDYARKNGIPSTSSETYQKKNNIAPLDEKRKRRLEAIDKAMGGDLMEGDAAC